ncbi:hypothetical protein E2C01_038671 [Portunus trituberculatus]|uniref:Uncharacterized protein n=1 Tax=Portunus trituberculatus TaxID=210409 RepID=A0A5B7FIK5_PORTR|nr:hypothetical protein [Portunus trituberculatus]
MEPNSHKCTANFGPRQHTPTTTDTISWYGVALHGKHTHSQADTHARAERRANQHKASKNRHYRCLAGRDTGGAGCSQRPRPQPRPCGTHNSPAAPQQRPAVPAHHSGTSLTTQGRWLALGPSLGVRRHSLGHPGPAVHHTSLFSLLTGRDAQSWDPEGAAGARPATPASISPYFGVCVAEKRVKVTVVSGGGSRGHLPRPPWPPRRHRHHLTAKKLNRKTRKMLWRRGTKAWSARRAGAAWHSLVGAAACWGGGTTSPLRSGGWIIIWSLRRLIWVESRVRGGNGGGISPVATHTKGDLPVHLTYIFVLPSATPPHGSSRPSLAGVAADRCGGGAGLRAASQPPG